MKQGPTDFTEVQQAIGYSFKDIDLLLAALTHSSSHAGAKDSVVDNERLEFLGDRVLGLVISHYLIENFKTAKEGELARRFNSLVKRQMCAEIGFEIELGRFMILSAGEERSGGREKPTIIANAMEAVLGAVFLDGGYSEVDTLIQRLWSDKLSKMPRVLIDAKSQLQEWAQGRGFGLPQYENIHREGPDHKPIFVVEVKVAGVGSKQGEGTSIRSAEQQAAKIMLENEGVWEGHSNE